MPINKNREDFRFYKIWADMKQRCNNPKNAKFSIYGGRGIHYYPEWVSYEGFKNDMWQSYQEHVKVYGEKQTTLDRIDSNDNYYKENCRWATYTEQRVNIRDKEEYCGYNLITNQFYHFNNCAEFARAFGFTRQNIRLVINGTLNHHHNCIFAKVEDDSHKTYVELLERAKKVFELYPQLAKQNKLYRESKDENSKN